MTDAIRAEAAAVSADEMADYIAAGIDPECYVESHPGAPKPDVHLEGSTITVTIGATVYTINVKRRIQHQSDVAALRAAVSCGVLDIEVAERVIARLEGEKT